MYLRSIIGCWPQLCIKIHNKCSWLDYIKGLHLHGYLFMLMLFLYCTDFSLCVKSLIIVLHHPWQLCLLVHWLLLQLLPLLSHQLGNLVLWVRIMKFCHWYWWTSWGVLLASLLSCSNNFKLRSGQGAACLLPLRLIPIKPFDPLGWVLCSQIWASQIFYVSVMMIAFYFQVLVGSHFTPVSTQPLRFAPLKPLGACSGRCMSFLALVIYPYQECTKKLHPPAFSWGCLMLLKIPFSSHSSNMVGIHLCGLNRESTNPFSFPK